MSILKIKLNESQSSSLIIKFKYSSVITLKKSQKNLSDPKSSKDLLFPRGYQKERQKLTWEKNPIIYHQEDARREKLTTYIVTFPNPPLYKTR